MRLNLGALQEGIEKEYGQFKTAMVQPHVLNAAMQATPGATNVATHAAPGMLKTLGKGALKSLPIVGNVVSGGMAINDAMHGNWVDAGLNTVGAIPGLGNAVNFGAMGASMLMPDRLKQSINNTISAPFNAIKAVGEIPGKLSNMVGQIAPLALPLMLGGSNRTANQPQISQQPINYLAQNPAQVSSMNAPYMQQYKQAGVIISALQDAAKRRAANNVINAVIPPQQELSEIPQAQQKKIELTSNYPEISKILEDEQNKAYLERLLSQP